ncbi:hypothetical protein CYMTET_28465 [Cymbomonas tetramitiformis]|uniref:Protein YIP n=1 Tax=Cymbomonas tetramitiformis TaxID=36881 RepID=A0AAE0FMX0_9CHLO|nr:hypothetical protein CYMTET_28465 [Cymbomonas tetramitiformis]
MSSVPVAFDAPPSQASASSIPFMSFDGSASNVDPYAGGFASGAPPIGTIGSGPPSGGFRSGPPSGGFRSGPPSNGFGGSWQPPPPISTSYNSFDEEPPLLEELGIDPALVFRKSLAILNPLKLDATLMDDGDLSGPLLYGLALGSCHLLVGKIQFGDILGFSVVALVGLYWLLNVLAGPDSGGIELHRVSSLAGYSLLPLVLHSALCVLMPGRSTLGSILAVVAVTWCAYAASNLLVAALPQLRDQRALVAYPCLLMYSVYALMTIY